MKRIFLVLGLVAAITSAEAQKLRVGIEGAYNSTWLFNKNVSDAGEELDYASTFGYQVGATVIYDFKEGVGISTGILMGTVNQKYTNFKNNPALKYESQTMLTYIDVPLLFRITSPKGPYFEIGPQFSFISKAETEGKTSTQDIKDEVNSVNISAQIGFGYDIKASEKLTIGLGLRFGYGLTDAGKEPDNAVGYEKTNTAVGGFRVGLNYAL
jgi:Outer membrane protein beta-barrel domain